MRKGRIKKDNSKPNNKFLLVIVFIVLLLFGNAYALLNQDLTLSGTVKILGPNIDLKESTTSNVVGSGTTILFFTFYNKGTITIVITNNSGKDVTNWVLNATITNGNNNLTATAQTCNFDRYYLNGRNLTLFGDEGSVNGNIPNGTSKTIKFDIGYNTNVTFNMTATLNSVYSDTKLAYKQTNEYINSTAVGNGRSAQSLLSAIDTQSLDTNISQNNFVDFKNIEPAKDVTFENENIKINISFDEKLYSDNIYATDAIVRVENLESKNIDSLNFDMTFDDPLETLGTASIEGAKISSFDENSLKIELNENDYISANSFKIFRISNIITEGRFPLLNIKNVNYSFENKDIHYENVNEVEENNNDENTIIEPVEMNQDEEGKQTDKNQDIDNTISNEHDITTEEVDSSNENIAEESISNTEEKNVINGIENTIS